MIVRGWVRLLSAICVVGAVATGVVANPGAVQAIPDLQWGSCDPIHNSSSATSCATVTVPRDYAKPNGPTIQVTVSRIAARNQSAKRGVLVGNPGGPSGDAISMFTALGMPDQIRDEWDLVAVQPRGLISSTPVTCDSTSGKPNDCAKKSPGYARTLTTENTARDIEQVRRAMGIEKISLYGVSYGTWLMSTYATLFPAHTDRVILDSGMDPKRAWGPLLQDQTRGYQIRTHAMMAWIAKHDDVYHLGRTPLAVYRLWSDKVSAEAGVPPSLTAPPAQVGDVPPGLRAIAKQYVEGVNLTADARARLENFLSTLAKPGHVQSTSHLLAVTRMAAPDRNSWPYVAQRMTGQIKAKKPSKAAIALATNAQAMQSQIICNEDWAPHDPTLLPAALTQMLVIGDVFSSPGLTARSGIACAGTAPTTRRVPLRNTNLAVQPLQIQSLGDPQTPYGPSMAMRRAMRAHLITVGGGDHGQLWRTNPKLQAAVVDYLRTGQTSVTSVPQGAISTPLTGG